MVPANHLARVGAQTHAAAHVLDVLLVEHQVDDRVLGDGIEFGGVGARETGHVASELRDRDLHPETDAEVRHLVLARVTSGADLALDAADAEPARHEDAVHLHEQLVDLLGSERLGVEPVRVDLHVVEDAGVVERLVDREVRVGQLHVLADQADVDLVGQRRRVRDERVPLGHVTRSALQLQPVDDHLVEPLCRAGSPAPRRSSARRAPR